jgi:hypothetical protein
MPSWCARRNVRVSPGLKDHLLDAENFCLAEITIAQRFSLASKMPVRRGGGPLQNRTARWMPGFAEAARFRGGRPFVLQKIKLRFEQAHRTLGSHAELCYSEYSIRAVYLARLSACRRGVAQPG